MKTPLLEARGLTVATCSGRILLQDLRLSLGAERVALVGRNGVGKTTLLETLAGLHKPHKGQVKWRIPPHLVSQLQDAQVGLSQGQLRKQRLQMALQSRPEMLLLDEPTQDLDEEGVSWLRGCLNRWRGGLMVASHDTDLLQDFQDFFLLSESGCRHFRGTLQELEEHLERQHSAQEVGYLRKLHRMVEVQEHGEKVARRRARKKRYGRVREIDRATPRCILNQKRDAAQDNHGRDQRNREARLDSIRQWALAGRRALKVELPMAQCPVSPLACGETSAIVKLHEVSSLRQGRVLFEDLSAELRHHRLAVVGPNGAGKTTLLELMLGLGEPYLGWVRSDLARIGSIAQGGSDWMRDESLLSLVDGPEQLVAHKFPLALGERPLRSLSPGERVRAALICLFQRSPTVELLILDEPTYSLDLLGKKALTRALQIWRGGLVVASHDRSFLRQIGVEQWLELGPR